MLSNSPESFERISDQPVVLMNSWWTEAVLDPIANVSKLEVIYRRDEIRVRKPVDIGALQY